MRPVPPPGPQARFNGPTSGSPGRAVGLLLAALVLGWLVLRTASFGSGVQRVRVLGPTTTTTAPVTTRLGRPLTSTTLRPARAPADVKVLPLNGSGVPGAAGRVGETLKAAGYNTLGADNAKEVARVLQLPPTAVQPLSSPPPVADVRGAGVVVVVGTDLARSLPSSGSVTTARRTTITARRPTVTTARPTVTTARTPASTAATATTQPSPTVTGGADAVPTSRGGRNGRQRGSGRDGTPGR